MSAPGPLYQCGRSLFGNPGCGRYFASGDRKSAVDVPEGTDVEVYTVGCWQCENCSPRAPREDRKDRGWLVSIEHSWTMEMDTGYTPGSAEEEAFMGRTMIEADAAHVEAWEALETECRALEVEARLATFSRGFAVDWGRWTP